MKYQVGDIVRIVKEEPKNAIPIWNVDGMMNKWCDRFMTINGSKDGCCQMREDKGENPQSLSTGWLWSENSIAGLAQDCLRVGDYVKCNKGRKPSGRYGRITYMAGAKITVKFPGFNGHSGDGTDNEKESWLLSKFDLIPINPEDVPNNIRAKFDSPLPALKPFSISLSYDGKKEITAKTDAFTAIARCNDSDKFDAEKDFKLALDRLFEKIKESLKEEQYVKDGEYVCVKNEGSFPECGVEAGTIVSLHKGVYKAKCGPLVHTIHMTDGVLYDDFGRTFALVNRL